jgi:hypothetical protein
MTDPNPPAGQTPPPNVPPAPPAYGSTEPSYASAPPAPYGAPAAPTIPGKTLGIVAFILSFFVQLVALILGIVALVQSKKAGHKNGWAVAAIIISAVLMVLGIIIAIVVLTTVFGSLAAACADLGPGVWELEGGGTITCN